MVRRDSAGIYIVESAAPLWQRGEQWQIDPVPEILIGSTQHFLDTSSSRHADGRPEPIPFERVRAIKVLSDGRIVVADAGPVEVMVFDSLGGLASRFVGRGGGPGELTSIGDVHVCERDSIVVVSQFDTVFDSAGAWLGGLTLPNRFDLRAVARGRVYGVARDSLDVETVLGRPTLTKMTGHIMFISTSRVVCCEN